MSDEIRYCAYCDQKVVKTADAKVITTAGVRGEYRHEKPSDQGIGNCGRQFLEEHETYTES